MKKRILVALLTLCFFITAAMLHKPYEKPDAAEPAAKQEIIQEIEVLTPFSSYKAYIVRTVKTDPGNAETGELPKHKKYSKIEIMPGVNKPDGT